MLTCIENKLLDAAISLTFSGLTGLVFKNSLFVRVLSMVVLPRDPANCQFSPSGVRALPLGCGQNVGCHY